MKLLNHRFFAYFSDAGAKALASYAEELTYNDQTILFEEGEPSSCIYLIQEGKVDLSKKAPNGNHVVIATVEANDYFGEMGVLDDHPRSTRAKCVGVTRAAMIQGPPLLRILHQEPSYVTLQFMKTILEHLRRTNEALVAETVKNMQALASTPPKG